MRASHTAAVVSAIFDELNLVSCAGLVAVLRLAERAGLHTTAQRRVVARRTRGGDHFGGGGDGGWR
ncbi:MAG: hypothetical protein ACRDSM_16145 [Pseudonocardiaceae bacterium]